MSSTRTIWEWVRPYCDNPDFYDVEIDEEDYVNVYCTGYGYSRQLQLRAQIIFGSIMQIEALERAIRLRTRAAKRRIYGPKEV